MTVNRQTVPDASPAVVTPSGDLAVRAAAPAGPSQEAADYAAAQAHRVRLLELCDAVVTSSSRLNDPSAARSVTELRQRLAGDGFQVMVVGDFKRGKSTFVNALLGQRILPVKATPTTAVITQVRFSEEAAAFLYRVEGEEPERIDPRDLDRRITIDNSHPDSPNPFVLAEVTWPLEL
ncbi:MAG TPA: dynamin family protein, partial [Kineosporiaceae bacterium]